MRADDLKKLWQGVLLQAMRDALSNEESKDKITRDARRDARCWLAEAGKDFRTVCHLAGFDPDRVAEWWRAENGR